MIKVDNPLSLMMKCARVRVGGGCCTSGRVGRSSLVATVLDVTTIRSVSCSRCCYDGQLNSRALYLFNGQVSQSGKAVAQGANILLPVIGQHET